MSAAALPSDPSDLIVLASQWWGESYAQFPAVAHLQPGDYFAGDDPGAKILASHAGFKVILPIQNRTGNKWSGPLVPFAFEFSPKNGLVEIIGFFGSGITEEEFVTSLRNVYGPPDWFSEAFNLRFVSYAWMFDKSTLGVNFENFYITPKGTIAF
ncbi:MAG TPA: hypothetical protein VMF11_06075 [Candidatus Baltobacteraceae bacterium]|nr:hypothetical protein [Candidatus Baltobacteraceae bacterium]